MLFLFPRTAYLCSITSHCAERISAVFMLGWRLSSVQAQASNLKSVNHYPGMWLSFQLHHRVNYNNKICVCTNDVHYKNTALIAHYLEHLIIKAGFWTLMGFSLKRVSEVISGLKARNDKRPVFAFLPLSV